MRRVNGFVVYASALCERNRIHFLYRVRKKKTNKWIVCFAYATNASIVYYCFFFCFSFHLFLCEYMQFSVLCAQIEYAQPFFLFFFFFLSINTLDHSTNKRTSTSNALCSVWWLIYEESWELNVPISFQSNANKRNLCPKTNNNNLILI